MRQLACQKWHASDVRAGDCQASLANAKVGLLGVVFAACSLREQIGRAFKLKGVATQSQARMRL